MHELIYYAAQMIAIQYEKLMHHPGYSLTTQDL